MGSHPRRTRAATPESCPLPSEDARWVPGPRRWTYGGLPAHAWGQWREARPAVGDTRCPQAGRAARAHGGGEAPPPAAARTARRGPSGRAAARARQPRGRARRGAARGSARRDTKLPQSGSVRFRGRPPGSSPARPLPAPKPRRALPGRPRLLPAPGAPAAVRSAPLGCPPRPGLPRLALRPGPPCAPASNTAAGTQRGRAGPGRAGRSPLPPPRGWDSPTGRAAVPGRARTLIGPDCSHSARAEGGAGSAPRPGPAPPPSPAALSPGPALRGAPGPPRPARREPPDAPPAAGPSAR